MARISGVNLPTNKRVKIALTYIYGIGPTTANQICKEVGISDDKRAEIYIEQIKEALVSGKISTINAAVSLPVSSAII